MNPLTLPVKDSRGRVLFTLAKSGPVRAAVNKGLMSEADALKTKWYLRNRTIGTVKLAVDKAEAIALAKAELAAVAADPVGFAGHKEAEQAKRGIKFQPLADEWLKLGLPDETGSPRKSKSQEPLKYNIGLALKWWGNKSAAATTSTTISAFADERRQVAAKRGYKGNRQVDLELSALSSLSQWAVYKGTLDNNPFDDRARFVKTTEIENCSEFAPDSSEEWNKILRWGFESEPRQSGFASQWSEQDAARRRRIAFAWLTFTGLTGLRPEEPQFLKRLPRLNDTPSMPANLEPGTIFTARDGTVKMRVRRTKQRNKKKERNPFVTLWPAALDFLGEWESWLDNNLTPNADMMWFPNPEKPATPLVGEGVNFQFLNKSLEKAVKALKTKRFKPKGFGRAFYVRVRRSMGLENAMIASELGQTGNTDLIDQVYGVAEDMVGGAAFDWFPKDGEPAWRALNPDREATNIVPLRKAAQ